jgi:lipopolysaccharide transport system permease protein
MTLKQYFKLVDVQARLGLKADAAKFYLGYIWWVLEPLLFVAIFYLVFDVIMDSGRSDFLVFLMCGKLPFVWFTKSVNTASGSIVGSASLIGKIDVPKTMFPMVLVQEGLYRQVTVFGILLFVLLANGYTPSWVWLWFLPVALLQYVMIVGCSFIGAVLVCFVRDFSMIIQLGMIFLMFTSGVFWDARSLASAQMTEAILTYNPMAFVLDAYRQVLMYHTAPDQGLLLANFVLFSLVLALAVRFMRSNSQLLALRALTA